LSKLTVGELILGDGYAGSIAKRGEGGKRSLDVVRNKLNDDIYVLREAEISVCGNCQPTRDEITYPGLFEGSRKRFEAGEFHCLRGSAGPRSEA
jgi:hypothetical protein